MDWIHGVALQTWQVSSVRISYQHNCNGRSGPRNSFVFVSDTTFVFVFVFGFVFDKCRICCHHNCNERRGEACGAHLLPTAHNIWCHRKLTWREIINLYLFFPLHLNNFLCFQGSEPSTDCAVSLLNCFALTPLSGSCPGEASAPYTGLCQFGKSHLAANLWNGTIIAFKIWERIKDLPRYK